MTQSSHLAKRFLLILSAVLLLFPIEKSKAGGGPENVFLVVNSRSWPSLAVANFYCSLRDIPSKNVLYLDWSRSNNSTSIKTFREFLLKNIFEAIKRRKLSHQIDYIVYSSDFPFRIHFGADFQQNIKYAFGSLTGMTYLWSLAMSEKHDYMHLASNWYTRPFRSNRFAVSSQGFRSGYLWNPAGERVKSGGRQYILSSMLAYTSGRGNSVREVARYLHRSARVDGTHPNGTFYYVESNDSARSKPRDPYYRQAIRELNRLGLAAQLLHGTIPQQKLDVQGAMLGIAKYDWKSSQSRILPGAFCDNLTSFAGYLSEGVSQTPLTEYLRYGASGASGTVAEPTNVPQKFPHPVFHVHYARGCSLAESFYQSVSAPYQQLLVGDPLCQPWARIPTVQIDGVQPYQTVRGAIKITPRSESHPQEQIAFFQLFIDGTLVDQKKPGEAFEFDTSELSDGYHELRIVGVDATTIQTQGRQVVPLNINNHGHRIEYLITPKSNVQFSGKLTLRVKAPGADEILIQHNHRIIAKAEKSEELFQIDPKILGFGPVKLQIISLKNKKSLAVSPWIPITVSRPSLLPSLDIPLSKRLTAGLKLKRSNGSTYSITKTLRNNWFTEAGLTPNQPFEISGFLPLTQDALFQFQAEYKGELEILIDGILLFQKSNKRLQRYYILAPLAAGQHRVQIIGKTLSPRLMLSFGTEGTRAIGNLQFQHEL